MALMYRDVCQVTTTSLRQYTYYILLELKKAFYFILNFNYIGPLYMALMYRGVLKVTTTSVRQYNNNILLELKKALDVTLKFNYRRS